MVVVVVVAVLVVVVVVAGGGVRGESCVAIGKEEKGATGEEDRDNK